MHAPEVFDEPVLAQDHGLADSLDWGAITSSLASQQEEQQKEEEQKEEEEEEDKSFVTRV